MTKSTDFPEAEPADHAAQLNAPERLSALEAADLLDTLPEAAFDRAVRLATRVTGTPVGLVSLVDGERQFFKAQLGLGEPYASRRETGLTHSFCQYVVTADTPLCVADARTHPLLKDNLAVPDMHVVGYLGIPIHSPDGQAIGSFCAIDTAPHDWTPGEIEALQDISAGLETEIALRRTLSERQLLLEELNHRIKNLFAVVSGIVSLSLRSGDTPESMAQTLRSRIQALAQAHDLIVPVVTAHRATGTEVSLNKLVATLLEPHLHSDDARLAAHGPTLTLGPKFSTSLALALHELATNASKYGALSTNDGALEINWDVDEDVLQINWIERGGPAIDGPPVASSSGFGSRLIKMTVEGQLSGVVETDWKPTGLQCSLRLPMDRLAV